MRKDDILEEKKKLDETISSIKTISEDTKMYLNSLPSRVKDPFLLAEFMELNTLKLNNLSKNEKKPYFARIDFKENDQKETQKLYISKVGVIDFDSNMITVDWRAPVASLYYSNRIGEVSYHAPEGLIEGNLGLKRQFTIEEGKLIDYMDVDAISGDELLKPYLTTNADSRLKNIVASIQKEQDDIIRENITSNLIVQGVAGSGKTTVALHRIAFLAYNYKENIKPNQFMVIGPNNIFIDYISSVLPDLDVGNVLQLTFEELVKKYIGENFEVNNSSDKLLKIIEGEENTEIDKFKTSMNYKYALDMFIKDFDEKVVPTKGLMLGDFEVLDYSTIYKVYSKENDNKDIKSKVNKTILYLSKNILFNAVSIHEKSRDHLYILADKQNDYSIIKKQNLYKKEIESGCKKILKQHFSKVDTKILTLYKNFINDIEKYIDTETIDIIKLQKETRKNIIKKKVDIEDLPALMYLKYKLHGSGEYEKYKHVVIDEAQDLGDFNFFVINSVMKNSTFSIFGDLAQAVYSYRGIENWESVNKYTFENNTKKMRLSKSYRTTVEIMNAANSITTNLGLEPAKPVIRHGKNVIFNQISKVDKIDYLIEKISDMQNRGLMFISIICKTQKEINELSSDFEKKNFNIDVFSENNRQYNKGVCIISSYLAKGLEFDATIINDASEKTYNSNNDLDLKLLYVSMTRPLHELVVLHEGEISNVLKNVI